MTKDDTMCIEIQQSQFEKEVIQSQIPVLVEIKTEWSGTCQIIAPVLEILASHYKGRLKIVRIDADLNKELIGNFGIVDFPFFLLYRNGLLINHFKGVTSIGDLETKVEQAFQITQTEGGTK
jgi:thioredoxin 1